MPVSKYSVFIENLRYTKANRSGHNCHRRASFLLFPRGGCLSSCCHNKIPWTGGLNNRHSFRTVLEAEHSRLKCHLLGYLVRTLFLASHCGLTWQRERERESTLWFFSYKGANHIMSSPPTLMSSSKPNHLPKVPFLLPSHCRVGCQHNEF